MNSVKYITVPGLPGYRVGDDGSVWTRLKRVYRKGSEGKGVRYIPGDSWTPLMATKTGKQKKHLLVQLRNEGVIHYWLIHRLVLELFRGPCPEGMECAHENGIPSDNRLCNLRWTTRRDNSADKIAHGTDPKGERNPRHKLKEIEVIEILKSLDGGMDKQMLADKYIVSRLTIWEISKGKTWKHLPRN